MPIAKPIFVDWLRPPEDVDEDVGAGVEADIEMGVARDGEVGFEGDIEAAV